MFCILFVVYFEDEKGSYSQRYMLYEVNIKSLRTTEIGLLK